MKPSIEEDPRSFREDRRESEEEGEDIKKISISISGFSVTYHHSWAFASSGTFRILKANRSRIKQFTIKNTTTTTLSLFRDLSITIIQYTFRYSPLQHYTMARRKRRLLLLLLSSVLLHHPAASKQADQQLEEEDVEEDEEEEEILLLQESSMLQCPVSAMSEFEEGIGICFNSFHEEEEEVRRTFSMHDFFAVFHRLGTSWKSIVVMFRDIISWANGSNRKGDIYAKTMDEAVFLMRDMVSTTIAATVSDSKNVNITSENPMLFRTVPLQEFQVTLDDLYQLFLRWAIADGSKDDFKSCKRRGSVNGKQNGKINVSKAYRRLERYALWMEQIGGDILLDPPLTAHSIRTAWNEFSMALSYDECNRLVWWLDLGKSDLQGVRALSPEQIVRLYIWFSHLLLFDRNGQENGIVFVNDLGRASFGKFMTMLPFELGIKLDEFMISVIPLKTKLVVFMNRPPWAKFGYSLLSVFMTRQMKKRVVMVPEKRVREVVMDAVGADCIPEGFGHLNGTFADDIFGLQRRIDSNN